MRFASVIVATIGFAQVAFADTARMECTTEEIGNRTVMPCVIAFPEPAPTFRSDGPFKDLLTAVERIDRKQR